MKEVNPRRNLPLLFTSACASAASVVGYLSGKVMLTVIFSEKAAPQAIAEMSPTHSAVMACVAMSGPLLVTAVDEFDRIRSYNPLHVSVVASHMLGKAVALADVLITRP